MQREIKIDRAIYIADDTAKTYAFLKRNTDPGKPGKNENEKNKQSINGYTRILKDGRTKLYTRPEHP